MRHRRRGTTITTATAATLLLVAGPALACGALVGADGTIELGRTTTLSAYTDGVQRYVTGFEFTGQGEQVGSITPLPDVPSDVERAGDWTLQRLVREVTPQPERAFAAETDDAADASAEVLLETEVDALDLTVLRGGADEVGRWAVDNGFFLSADAPEMLDFYAERSEIFLAARFDAGRAADLGQQAGTSTPVMVTIPTDRPWVPLRILSLGATDDQVIEADVFLLTDHEPQLLAGGRDGLALEVSEPASPALLDDLRSDERMEWLPQEQWLTYLEVSAQADELTYDLAVSVDEEVRPSLVDAGVEAAWAATPVTVAPEGRSWWPAAAGLLAAALVLGAVATTRRGRREVSS